MGRAEAENTGIQGTVNVLGLKRQDVASG